MAVPWSEERRTPKRFAECQVNCLFELNSVSLSEWPDISHYRNFALLLLQQFPQNRPIWLLQTTFYRDDRYETLLWVRTACWIATSKTSYVYFVCARTEHGDVLGYLLRGTSSFHARWFPLPLHVKYCSFFRGKNFVWRRMQKDISSFNLIQQSHVERNQPLKHTRFQSCRKKYAYLISIATSVTSCNVECVVLTQKDSKSQVISMAGSLGTDRKKA